MYVLVFFSRRGGNEIIKVDDDKSADIHLIMQESWNNDPGWLLVAVGSSIVFANRTNQEKGGHFYLFLRTGIVIISKFDRFQTEKIFSSDISRWERGKKKKSGGVCAGAVASGDQR